jgi:hypothetical protein
LQGFVLGKHVISISLPTRWSVTFFHRLFDRLSPFGFRNRGHHPEERRTLSPSNVLFNSALTMLDKETGGSNAWSSRLAILSALICFMLPAYIASLTAILTVRPLQPTLLSWTDVQVRCVRVHVSVSPHHNATRADERRPVRGGTWLGGSKLAHGKLCELLSFGRYFVYCGVAFCFAVSCCLSEHAHLSDCCGRCKSIEG